MRVVLDTNTVVSGLFWRGKPFQVLELMRSGFRAFSKIGVKCLKKIRDFAIDESLVN